MLYKLVTLVLFVLLGTVAVASAQAPAGYWLYVDGAWKGGFLGRAECDTAAAKQTGRVYECRPVMLNPAPGAQGTFQQGIAACSQWANVDAFTKPGGQVQYLGTTKERFNFEKCMSQNGQPLR